MSQKYPDSRPDTGAYVPELTTFTPEVQLGYNAAGDLIKLRKKTASGAIFEREILKKTVSDYEIVKWDVVTRWRQII